MKNRLLLLFLFVIPFVMAQPQIDYNDVESMDINFKLDSQFFLIPNNEKYGIDLVETNLTFFPQNTISQEIISLSTSTFPAADVLVESNSIIYRWGKSKNQQYFYSLNSKIRLKNKLIGISDIIEFPITSNEFMEYTYPTKFIDIDDDIRNKAQEIAEGEDDLYVVTFKIADWVESNIQYNLSTLTADVVQKSSWVFDNKEGVCDELTNLFISMVRSLGIPAKFVSGVAYTNTNGLWGPHAWAEVYFPGGGWIPFDITYGQFGWIDPTHLKLMETADSGEASAKFSWKSYNVDFNADEIKLDTILLSEGNKINPIVEMVVTPLKNNVGPGSYVPIKINIKNLNNFYLPESLFVIKAPGLTERNIKHLLLKPNQEKTIFWIVKIPDNVENDYLYSTTFEIRDLMHEFASERINYGENFRKITEKEATDIIKNLDVEEEKTYSKEISLYCNVGNRTYIFVYEGIQAKCVIMNTGNTKLENIDVCHNEDCKTINLLIGGKEEISFNLTELVPLQEKLKFSASNSDVSVNEYVDVSILEKPELRINKFDYPIMLDYNENIVLEFSLLSRAPVKHLSISMNGRDVYDLSDLDVQKSIKIDSSGKDFSIADRIVFEFKYYDENGKKYEKKEEFPIEIVNRPWYARMFKFFADLV